MKSSSSSFESILEALLKQKQVLEDLHAENAALHRQLADLRAGRGVFLEILGTRFALAGMADVQGASTVSNGSSAFVDTIEDTRPVVAVRPAQKGASPKETAAVQATDADSAIQTTTAFTAANADPAIQTTTAIPGEFLQSWGPETPSPAADFLIEDVSENEAPMPMAASSTFLTDTLLAEFSAASARHVGNWSGPHTNGPITNNPDLDEDEKAALRRELLGSYILE